MKAQSQVSTSRGTSRLTRLATSALFVAGSCVPLLTAAMPVAAQSATVSFSTAELAPADAFAYSVMTLDNKSDQWLLSEELLRRAGFGEAIDQAISEELTDENGKPLPLDAFMGGEIGVVVDDSTLDSAVEESLNSDELGMMTGDLDSTEDDSDANDLQGIAAILDTRAPDTAWTGISQSAMEDDSETTDYNGTEIIFSEPADDEDSGMAAARVGDHILLASTPEDLHPLIDTANGENDNITSVPQFSTALDALPAEFMSFTFVNNGVASDVDLGPFESSFSSLVNDSFTGVTVSADQPGFRFESVTVPGEDALPPIPAAYDSSLEVIAPEEALVFFSAPDLGESGILDALGAALLGVAFGMSDPALAEGTPEATADPDAAIAKQYEDAAGILGVNLQTDLFQQFAGEYGAWLTADAAMESGSGVFASQVSDPDTVSNTLMQLSFLIQGAMGGETALATRAVGEGSVYSLDLGDGTTFEFGVVGDMFVMGTGDAVERFAGPDSASLSADTLYQDVMGTLPEDTNSIFFIDLEQAIPLAETASESSDDFGFDTGVGFEDASEACADYATQEEAQTAYDAGEPNTFDLDQDFDGDVCEDYFAPAAVEVSDDSDDAGSDFEDTLANADYSAVKAFAVVGHEEDGLQHASGILYIAE
ncbi:MAG: DUF3352 domain-containing protein [Chloroflexota bacterium]|nr:DUF3352 domain-containing protein [Chloroflexota bacterium]